ncbi:MAG: hypothetical protein ACLUD0_18050 [Eubacterium ramulus]
MATFYQLHYPKFEKQRFVKLMNQFQLDERRKVGSFSKGMKKQLMVLLGISAGTKYLLCDETFDGLDPVVRQGVKSLLAAEIMSRDFTPVLASHNLRELEDICDHVGLLHKGGMLLSKDLEDMKFYIHKDTVCSDRQETGRGTEKRTGHSKDRSSGIACIVYSKRYAVRNHGKDTGEESIVQ